MKIRHKMFNGLCPELSVEKVRRIASETKFVERCWKKISPEDFLNYYCYESIKGTVSYNDIAAKIAAEEGHQASKQAYYDRVDDNCVEFFKCILAEVMKTKYDMENLVDTELAKNFNRILLQDSTTIRLPQKLYAIFSGARNADVSACNARIQGVYDLLSRRFVYFSITPYSKNDFAAVNDFQLQEGDLMLRDRGYLCCIGITNAIDNGADLISRYKNKTKFIDPETGKDFDLLGMLKEKGKIDIIALAGEEEKVQVRIIAEPVSEEIANQRRMKAKKEAKGYLPSKNLLELMSWTIYVTTIKDPAFNFKLIFTLYSFRWRIEIIFKTWKSHLSFDKIHNVSEKQLNILLYARFIMICMLFVHGYEKFSSLVFVKLNKELSLLKFVRFASRNLMTFFKSCLNEREVSKLIQIIGKYCSYDSRRRENFNEQYRHTMLNLSYLYDLS